MEDKGQKVTVYMSVLGKGLRHTLGSTCAYVDE